MKKTCNEMSDKQFNDIKYKKFYISYTKNGKQKYRFKYKNKNQLLNAILKSIHIPYLTTGDYYHMEGKNKYLDGGQPYIFNNRDENDNKYIFYLDNSNLFTMFSIKKRIK